VKEAGSWYTKRICMSCPVLLQCREYAVFNRELYGVRGGLSEEDRLKLIGFPKVK
jgi:WhiB family transcriptional regulator, redox-sensing transcriptional regulator